MKHLTLLLLTLFIFSCKKEEKEDTVYEYYFIVDVLHNNEDDLKGEEVDILMKVQGTDGSAVTFDSPSTPIVENETITENLELNASSSEIVYITSTSNQINILLEAITESGLSKTGVNATAPPTKTTKTTNWDKSAVVTAGENQDYYGSWNTKDDTFTMETRKYTPNTGGDSGNTPDTDTPTAPDCQSWQTLYGACLDVNGNPGIKFRQCRQSETSNSVTYKVEFEPVNEGIDGDFYKNIQLSVEGEIVSKPTGASFNAYGFSTTETTVKYFEEGEYPLYNTAYCYRN